eukprot:747756-Hanusia_phi.AAC.1
MKSSEFYAPATTIMRVARGETRYPRPRLVTNLPARLPFVRWLWIGLKSVKQGGGQGGKVGGWLSLPENAENTQGTE